MAYDADAFARAEWRALEPPEEEPEYTLDDYLADEADRCRCDYLFDD